MEKSAAMDQELEPGLDAISAKEGYEDVDEREEISPQHYGITSYGADFPVDGLVKRMENRDIRVPTFDPGVGDEEIGVVGFQRDFVWSKPQSDRFIESFLLGFPVPGIFLVQGSEGVYLVLDGQQRLRTLQAFYAGTLRERTFRLQHVQKDFRGLAYDDLETDARRRLDNSIIHATVVRQEVPSEDQSGIYKIFERLNTGGTLLQPQEIRVALFNGPLIGLLRDLNEDEHWRAMCGNRSKRLKDQELILRFFAFRARSKKYEAPMKEFLNTYTAWNLDLGRQSAKELKTAFQATTQLIHERFGERAFRPARAVNAAAVDSLMTVVAEGIEQKSLRSTRALEKGYEKLFRNGEYRGAIERATAREENVKLRLRKAREALLK
ncbi:MAG TPA: DUF262 domain-containing protein [Solirubrobacterales bacterium]|jgi:hypothetical protein|nr:DUF262 domain-containing protein [Solirubrobacterales bacterium]